MKRGKRYPDNESVAAALRMMHRTGIRMVAASFYLPAPKSDRNLYRSRCRRTRIR